MTEQEIKDALEDWVRDYCRDEFADGLPPAVEVFIDKAYKELIAGGISSESLGDHSISYYVAANGFSPQLMALLHPYRRLGGLK